MIDHSRHANVVLMPQTMPHSLWKSLKFISEIMIIIPIYAAFKLRQTYNKYNLTMPKNTLKLAN